MNSLLNIDIKDSDYDNIGEFVYKYLDILLEDKLPEGEEKNIARTLLDYQQYIEDKFIRSIFELYRQVMYFCTNVELQNISIVMEIKDKVREISRCGKFYNISNNYIDNDICQTEWNSALKFIYCKDNLPKEVPDIFLIDNLIKDGYINVQDFINDYLVDKSINIYDI